MGPLGRQLNQQKGISWMASGMPQTLTTWSSPQITLEHSSSSILLTVGSTFTLRWASVRTLTPTSRSVFHWCACAIVLTRAGVWHGASFFLLLLFISLAQCCWLYVFLLYIQGPATIYCTVMWLKEIRLSPSTHLVAGHLVSHLKKEKQNITVSHFHNTLIIMISENLLSVCTHWPLLH